ncbi:MAG: MBL fold metallo-hydrolase [Bacillota bacterium]|nr:MBL fold metallo-hydrolase [Bacillota bacterium]
MSEYNLQTVPVRQASTNCYLLSCAASGDTAIIDPGGDAQLIISVIERLRLHPVMIVNTHGHWDHIAANHQLQQQYRLPLLIHELDQPLLSQSKLSMSFAFGEDGEGGQATRLLQHDDIIELGQLRLRVLHTPGHTQGGVCLLCEDLLFCGDTLFAGSIGRSDLPGGDYDTLMDSLKETVMQLDDSLRVLPGHGPESLLGREKRYNPYLRPY